jgi:hypothetical protein
VVVVSGGRDGGGGEDGGSGESEGKDTRVHGLCAAVLRVVRCLVGVVPILRAQSALHYIVASRCSMINAR